VRIRTIAALSVVSVIALVASIRWTGRHYLFPRRDVAVVAPPSSVETWTLSAADGEAVHAVGVWSGGGSGRVLVHFHNNRETAVDPIWLARELAGRGLDVVLVEYRGYGLSSAGAAPTEQGLYLDAEAALDELARRGYGPERVVLWGTSLGSGVAAEMARRHRGAALVLVSPYTSIADLVREHAHFTPPAILLPDRFDTEAKASDIHVPTLIIHGDADQIVPFRMGERLASSISGATLVRVQSGTHGDLFAHAEARLLDRIAEFAK
jgi:pimeloyl-ACP methyl ester carboxylesterase